MIDAWSVTPPRAAAIAQTVSGSKWATSPGVSSSAISTPGALGAATSGTPASWASTRRPTSVTSTARSRR
jgi:hypothetical protein